MCSARSTTSHSGCGKNRYMRTPAVERKRENCIKTATLLYSSSSPRSIKRRLSLVHVQYVVCCREKKSGFCACSYFAKYTGTVHKVTLSIRS